MNPFVSYWSLDPAVVFLNHGSFGACPTRILDRQQELRAELEREPVEFLYRRFEPRIDEARGALGRFLGADPDDLAFVPNATTGVNTVLRSLVFSPGDEIVVTDHEYNARRNALHFVAERSGARVVVAAVRFPLSSADEVVEGVLSAATGRTKLLLIDHVTSATGLVFPLKRIVDAFAERGVDTLVDGAHAPGMLSLDLDEIGVAYYTGNCHKWICTPKGSAFLHVRRDRQSLIRPLAISHGANSPRTDRSRFRLEFDFSGTDDPTPFLCIPDAIAFFEKILPGGWAEARDRNRALALRGRAILQEALSIPSPAPEDMVASLAAVPLPDRKDGLDLPPMGLDPVSKELFERHRIEALASVWPHSPKRVLRISAQLYNTEDQIRTLARALTGLL
ncbi:MAG: aminotransferase class V-fold PLP-dependent enzyme [Vicinamibacteria bacterium]